MKVYGCLVFTLICSVSVLPQEKIQFLDASSFMQIIPLGDLSLKKEMNPSFPNLKNQVINRGSRIFYYNDMSLIYLNSSTTMANLSWAYFTIPCLRNYLVLPENPDYDFCVKIAGKPLTEGADDKYLVIMYVKPINKKNCVIRLYFSKTDRQLKMLRLDF